MASSVTRSGSEPFRACSRPSTSSVGSMGTFPPSRNPKKRSMPKAEGCERGPRPRCHLPTSAVRQPFSRRIAGQVGVPGGRPRPAAPSSGEIQSVMPSSLP